ncbi:MAG: hypothetical protein FVQ84_17170 [Planctomycetes bacterium]|nr:hypothetical protein [Planctomycetota bacterium]
MNRKQKTCLLVGIAVIVVMGLWPPWVVESKELWAGKVKYTFEPGPYSWISSPPARPVEYKTEKERVVDRDNSIWINSTPEKKGYYKKVAWKNEYKKELVKLAAEARFIDLYRLGVQFFLVAVVTAGLIITFRDKKQEPVGTQQQD